MTKHATAAGGRRRWLAALGILNTIATLAFLDVAGIRMNEVPFKGSASVVTALAAGQVQFSNGPASTFRQSKT